MTAPSHLNDQVGGIIDRRRSTHENRRRPSRRMQSNEIKSAVARGVALAVKMNGEREGERGREGMPSEEKADNVKPHENDLVARWRLQRRKKSMVAIRFGSLP